MYQNTMSLPPTASTILERSREVFFNHWNTLLELRTTALATHDPDDIHDLRVSSRRFRSALDLYFPFAQKSPHTILKNKVRALTQALGGLRNIDEASLFLKTAGMVGDVSVDKICTKLEKQRVRDLKQIILSLHSFNQHSLDEIVQKMANRISEEFISERNRFSILGYFSDFSIRCYLPIHELSSITTNLDRHKERHSLRIAIKKWRYFLEIVSSVFNCDQTLLVAQLKDYQSVLGKMNDIREFYHVFAALGLSGEKQLLLNEILKHEEAKLMKSYLELVTSRPLSYSFLI